MLDTVKRAVDGVLEGVKGRTKQTAGAAAGDPDLEQEGRAQQDRAGAMRDEAQHRAQAEKARREAELEEARQRAHQHTEE
ncbi:MAG: CsbD family protein [Mycobacteriaceae bacterium]|nr:CsbD family protein [Mycobacteriaceae bacterium]